MTKFIYSAFLPGIGKSVYLKELNFKDYKQLVKLLHNDNNRSINDAFESLTNTLITEKIDTYTFLDRLILLLTIRSVCVFPTLELAMQSPTTKQQLNYIFEISTIIENISKPELFAKLNNKTVNYGNLQITYGIPDKVYFNNEEEAVVSTIKSIILKGKDCTQQKTAIFSALPASVFADAKQHIKSIENEINKLSLLSIRANFTQAELIEFNPSIINDSTLEFLKLLYKKELTSLYELEYFLASKLNLPYELIANSTFAELNTYLSFYTEEKKEQEKEAKQNNTNPLAAR